MRAGMVAAAHLQAHNQPSYQSWKMREEMDYPPRKTKAATGLSSVTAFG